MDTYKLFLVFSPQNVLFYAQYPTYFSQTFFSVCQAIMRPLAPRKSHLNLIICIAGIWSGGTLVALPAAIYADIIQKG
jgi:hypothetical protein